MSYRHTPRISRRYRTAFDANCSGPDAAAYDLGLGLMFLAHMLKAHPEVGNIVYRYEERVEGRRVARALTLSALATILHDATTAIDPAVNKGTKLREAIAEAQERIRMLRIKERAYIQNGATPMEILAIRGEQRGQEQVIALLSRLDHQQTPYSRAERAEVRSWDDWARRNGLLDENGNLLFDEEQE